MEMHSQESLYEIHGIVVRRDGSRSIVRRLVAAIVAFVAIVKRGIEAELAARRAKYSAAVGLRSGLGVVDRGGRRPLMIFGSISLAVIYTVLGFCYQHDVKGLPMLLLVLAAIACYSMSLAPVVWVIISEIFPNRIRGAAMSVSVSALDMPMAAMSATSTVR